MLGFTARDIFHHRVIGSLDGSPGHDRLAFMQSRALEREDDYERTLRGLHGADAKPVRLTMAESNAHHPRWNREGTRLAFLSDRGNGPQVHVLDMAGGEADALTSTDIHLTGIEGWGDGPGLLLLATFDWNEDGEAKETPKGRRPPQVARFRRSPAPRDDNVRPPRCGRRMRMPPASRGR
jgi:dipeptidyl aminopeptidase/acylaminoacyl peptidase